MSHERITGPIVAAPGQSSTVVIEAMEQTPITEFTTGSAAWADMFGPSRGLPAPTMTTAKRSTAIYACIGLISGGIMAMPVNLYAVDPKTGDRDRIYDHDLVWMLNEEMSPRWSSASGWEYLVSSLLFEGDAFAPIIRDRMYRPIGLEPVHPLRVLVATDGQRLKYRVMPEIVAGRSIGPVRDFDQDDMIHVPGFGFDGLRSVSPLRDALSQAGAIALATQDYAANFFANSARPDYALETDQRLDPTIVEDYRREIDLRHRSAENAHRPMVLHGGLKIKTWSLSATDMQLLEQRKFQLEEIARVYGVPAFMIGHTEKGSSWGTGLEQQGKNFVKWSLRKHIHKFEVELNRKLLRTSTRAIEFDPTDLERADLATTMIALRAAVGRAGEPGIMRVNEARRILRLAQDPNGNTLGVNPGTASPALAEDAIPPEPKQQQDNAE